MMRTCKHVPSNPLAAETPCELCGETIMAGPGGLYYTALEQYLGHFQTDAIPKMEMSQFVIAIGGKIDPKICLEIGAAVLLDKPLILAIPRGTPVSANLKRIAAEVIELSDPPDPADRGKVYAAIERLRQNDNRVRRPK